MCGRFTNRLTWREIVALYRLTVPAEPERNLQARYNICPTTTIDAVIEREGKRELVPMRWGLIPSWWKGSALNIQRPGRDGRREANVSLRVQAQSVSDPGLRLLRMEDNPNRQAALLLYGARRLAADHRRPMGRMEKYGDSRTAEVLHHDNN